MRKRKILLIGPVSAQADDCFSMAASFSFLDERYVIDCLDPLSLMDTVPNSVYYTRWEDKLAERINDCDAFFGFAFGGVILQQCFSLFTKKHKPIVLFSTPSFADCSLMQKLGTVVSLCQEKKLEEALEALYEPVFYPNQRPPLAVSAINREKAFERLIFGLTRVLQTDSTDLLKENTVEHLHLIGEYSNLVNKNNVITPKTGRLVVVPKASMRVMQDNPLYCKKTILEALNEHLY